MQLEVARAAPSKNLPPLNRLKPMLSTHRQKWVCFFKFPNRRLFGHFNPGKPGSLLDGGTHFGRLERRNYANSRLKFAGHRSKIPMS